MLYYTNLSQRVTNGNTPNFQVCDTQPRLLCEQDGATLLTGRGGAPIADFLNGGPYSQLDQNAINSNGYGASAQVTHKSDLFGLSNSLVAGASFDGGISSFNGNTEAGGRTLDRGFAGPGIVIDQSDLSLAPVRVNITNAYYGVFVSDILDLTPTVSLTLSGRENVAKIDLSDQNGTALTGNHSYSHFNPGIGLTWKILPNFSVYASYSQANRAPTLAELSCASITSPCTLTNFFVADPSLKQVVANTVETGVRGTVRPTADTSLMWNLGLFRTENHDDILFSPCTIIGRDFFQNIGTTQRQGIEAGITLRRGRLTANPGYAYIDATFQTSLTLDSPLNPAADANGQIHVRPGNRLPGIPAQRLKFGVQYQATDAWTVGLDGIASNGQALFGDEANLTPNTGSYVTLNFYNNYQITTHIQLFGQVQNALNARYYTYGTFSDTSSVPIAQVPGASNPRSLSPAAPVAGYGGLRVTF